MRVVAREDGDSGLARSDGAQELIAQLIRLLEFTNEGLGDHPLVAAPVFAEQEAELLGFHHAGGTAGLAVMHQGLRDIPRHPLLVGETVANGVHQPGDAPETVEPATGQVGDVGQPAEGDQMMRANAMDGDAADDHHVRAVVGKAFAQCCGRVQIVATEQAMFPQGTDAFGGTAHVGCVGSDAAGAQEVADGALEGDRVEGILPRNADAGGAG